MGWMWVIGMGEENEKNTGLLCLWTRLVPRGGDGGSVWIQPDGLWRFGRVTALREWTSTQVNHGKP
jgi:hypothetical protein